MSQHASTLCVLLVDDMYGGLTSRIFEVLLAYGRLDFRALLYHSHLSTTQIKHSLVVLVQQHLIFWCNSPQDDETYYEANLLNAYSLLRSGKLVKCAEDCMGVFGGDVFANLSLLGHAKVSDLESAYSTSLAAYSQDSSAASPAPVDSNSPISAGNGYLNNSITRGKSAMSKLQSALRMLVKSAFVIPVHSSDSRSTADNKLEAEKEIRRWPAFQGTLNTKQRIEFEIAVSEKMAEWQDGFKKAKRVKPSLKALPPKNGRKRSLEDQDDGKDAKRARRNVNLINGVHGHDANLEIVDDKFLNQATVLRVNNAKFIVLARNTRLLNLAENCLAEKCKSNESTIRVYAELLYRLMEDVPRCEKTSDIVESEDDYNGTEDAPQISTVQLSSSFDNSVAPLAGISMIDHKTFTSWYSERLRKEQKKNGVVDDKPDSEDSISADEDESMVNGLENGDKPEIESGTSPAEDGSGVEVKVKEEDENCAISGVQSVQDTVRQHLFLLSSHFHGFVDYRERTRSKPERWTVNYKRLSRLLRKIELENIISSRFGTEGARLVRILQEKGKLDDKAISLLGIIAQKPMRVVLASMHEAGYLELQEVPRDNNRQPTKTIYLWHFDRERCGQKVLGDTYQAMARCLQRLRVEREAVQLVIDKASRTDVVGKEDQYLGLEERQALSNWRRKEEEILGELGRLDDIVAVLRDF